MKPALKLKRFLANTEFSQLFNFNLCLKGRNKLLKLVKVLVVIEGNNVIYKEEDD